jgi:hypothetical protein
MDLLSSSSSDHPPFGLDYAQRIGLFITSFTFGIVCLMISSSMILGVFTGSAYKLVLMITLGHVLILVSTVFIAGCSAQVRNMTQGNRRLYSAIYLGSLIAGVVLAIRAPFAIVMIPVIIVQITAAIVYVLSYLPSCAVIKRARSLLPI